MSKEELEKENKTLKGCLLAEQEYTLVLEKENKELKQQIDKMKCCENCRRLWLKNYNETVTACSSCKDKNMWRLKK